MHATPCQCHTPKWKHVWKTRKTLGHASHTRAHDTVAASFTHDTNTRAFTLRYSESVRPCMQRVPPTRDPSQTRMTDPRHLRRLYTTMAGSSQPR